MYWQGLLIEIYSHTCYFQHSPHIRVNKVTYTLIKMTFTLNLNFLGAYKIFFWGILTLLPLLVVLLTLGTLSSYSLSSVTSSVSSNIGTDMTMRKLTGISFLAGQILIFFTELSFSLWFDRYNFAWFNFFTRKCSSF